MKTRFSAARRVSVVLLATALSGAVHADVTVTQKTNLQVASVINMHGGTTTSLTADKQREDSESHCEGIMSIVCGNLQSADIVRLDRDLTWHLEPKKKFYRETVFASPAELAQMRAKMQANLDRMNSCPVSQKQQPIDKSKCQMSPPKIEVHKTDDKMSIAGHAAQRTAASLIETCSDAATGDSCDTVVAVDLWLTQEQLPGSEDRMAFNRAYAKKMGLENMQVMFSGAVAKYLAPYQSQIKQLQDKSADLKGYPLKTALRVLVGGARCKAMATAKTDDSTAGGNNSAAPASPLSNPLGNVAQAGKAVGNLVGGLFHKKKTDDSSTTVPPPAADAPSAVAPGAVAPGVSPDPFANLTQIGTFSIETVAINTEAIPADRFEIPTGWTKETPRASKAGNDDFECPKPDK